MFSKLKSSLATHKIMLLFFSLGPIPPLLSNKNNSSYCVATFINGHTLRSHLNREGTVQTSCGNFFSSKINGHCEIRNRGTLWVALHITQCMSDCMANCGTVLIKYFDDILIVDWMESFKRMHVSILYIPCSDSGKSGKNANISRWLVEYCGPMWPAQIIHVCFFVFLFFPFKQQNLIS